MHEGQKLSEHLVEVRSALISAVQPALTRSHMRSSVHRTRVAPARPPRVADIGTLLPSALRALNGACLQERTFLRLSELLLRTAGLAGSGNVRFSLKPA